MPAWGKLALCLALAAVLVLNGIAWLAPEVGTFHDDGVYLVTAKALAEGKGYRIESLPNEIPQTKYPILFPLILAAAWRIDPHFPANLLLLKLVPLLASGFWLWLTWRLLRRQGAGPAAAWTIVLLAAASPWIIYFSTSILSETLFAAFATACLLLLHRPPEDRRALYLAALCAGCAFLTRSVGIALLATGPLWLLSRRRFADAARFALVALLVAAPWILWTSTRPASATPVDAYYSKENYQNWNIVRSFTPDQKAAIVGRNLLMAAFTPGMLSGMNVKGWGIPLAFVMLTLILWGALRRPFSPVHLFLLLYLALVFAWAWYPVRFLAPIFPLLLWMACKALASWPPPARRAAVGILILTVAIGTIVNTQATLARGAAYPEMQREEKWVDLARLLSWIDANTPRDSILAANLDPLFYLSTSRKSVRGFAVEPFALLYAGGAATHPLGTPDQFRQAILTHRVDYLILTPSTTFFEGPPLRDLVHRLAAEVPGALERCPAPVVPGYEVFRVDRVTLARLPKVPEPKAQAGSDTRVEAHR